jgi:hypothetical protein
MATPRAVARVRLSTFFRIVRRTTTTVPVRTLYQVHSTRYTVASTVITACSSDDAWHLAAPSL